MKIFQINFAGRNIELENSLLLDFLNTVQCPYLGENENNSTELYMMQKQSVENQLVNKKKKIISEEY